MSSATKRVCVVGAGASGLPAIRHAKLYGFEVVCYEGQDEIGGLWRYKPEQTDESSVMKSTVINSSKELTAYSDFPPRPDEANYMHNSSMFRYLKDYAQHYRLTDHILFRHRVVNIDRSMDYARTGRWNVTVLDTKTGESTQSTFDCVLVCSGHHTLPYIPEPWPGQDKYQGKIMHAHSYKDCKGYEDKNIVVVGVGNSAADISVELSRCAKQVYMVSRRGTWVRNRVFNYGRPSDCARDTRLVEFVRWAYPEWIISSQGKKRLNERFDHELYGLQPTFGTASAHPTVNDDLPNRIICGSIKVKPSIEKFTETGIIFTDGSSIDNVDEVILATGYSFEFPFIENGGLIKVTENRADLYEYILPMACEHDTLAIIGLIQPCGSVIPISEMQVRVVLDVLAGGSTLPSKHERREVMKRKQQEMAARYVNSRRHTIQVDYISYMDELAELIGAAPPAWYTFLLSDPAMAAHCLLAPVASYFYRVRGPHPWSGAREAIFTIEDRIVKGTNPSRTGGSLWHLRHIGISHVILLFAIPSFVLYFILQNLF